MVAVSFIIFDVEMVFLYPWAVVFKDLGWAGFVSMLIFLFVLCVGLAYEWMKGGLDWN
jgi:NADH-quinone oxidoreductase subunit A